MRGYVLVVQLYGQDLMTMLHLIKAARCSGLLSNRLHYSRASHHHHHAGGASHAQHI